jgi:DinB family protein
MDRTEIEIKLNRDRAWLLETVAALPEDDVTKPATKSEGDASKTWSAKDHLAHLVGIERWFNAMIRRHLDGDANPVGLQKDAQGVDRSMDQIMAGVHRMNEQWVQEHREKPLSEVVALGQQMRAETLDLLANLGDDQLLEKLPGAPWADGTVGGVLAANADHGRMHWKWVKEGWGRSGS